MKDSESTFGGLHEDDAPELIPNVSSLPNSQAQQDDIEKPYGTKMIRFKMDSDKPGSYEAQEVGFELEGFQVYDVDVDIVRMLLTELSIGFQQSVAGYLQELSDEKGQHMIYSYKLPEGDSLNFDNSRSPELIIMEIGPAVEPYMILSIVTLDCREAPERFTSDWREAALGTGIQIPISSPKNPGGDYYCNFDPEDKPAEFLTDFENKLKDLPFSTTRTDWRRFFFEHYEKHRLQPKYPKDTGQIEFSLCLIRKWYIREPSEDSELKRQYGIGLRSPGSYPPRSFFFIYQPWFRKDFTPVATAKPIEWLDMCPNDSTSATRLFQEFKTFNPYPERRKIIINAGHQRSSKWPGISSEDSYYSLRKDLLMNWPDRELRSLSHFLRYMERKQNTTLFVNHASRFSFEHYIRMRGWSCEPQSEDFLSLVELGKYQTPS